MENSPTNQPPGVDKLDLIEKFKDGDPEAVMLMRDWCHEEQRKIGRGEISRTDYYLSKAEIYREGGLTEEAIQAFEKAREVAMEEDEDKIVELCENEISRLR